MSKTKATIAFILLSTLPFLVGAAYLAVKFEAVILGIKGVTV
jgi:hypothetical protein